MVVMEFEVLRASVVVGDGADKVYITVRVPSPIWPFDVEQTSITINAAHGRGKEWLDKHFPAVGAIAEVLVAGSSSLP